jgi:deoxyribose-phosphate aldolase
MDRKTLAGMIDHTILKPEATADDVRRVVLEAISHQFASVCVNGRWVPLVASLLESTGIKTCAVVGFPLGASSPAAKAREAWSCVVAGAREIDMVVSLGDLLAGPQNYQRVTEDIAGVVKAAKSEGTPVIVKVILETVLLTEELIRAGCVAAKKGGADFVKTSTGFHPKGGATEDAVRWLKKYGGELGLKVKAAGGIRDLVIAQKMIDAGADRLGCSASVVIISGLPE